MRTNQQGFMLIQTLVAAGLMALLGLGMASMMKDMWTQNSSIQAKSSEISLSENIRQRLSTPLLCMKSLTNKSNFSPTAAERKLSVDIGDSGTPVAVAEGQTLQNWKVKVNKFYLNDIVEAVGSFNGETLYAGTIRFQAESLVGGKTEYKEKPLGTLFVKSNDSSKVITDCFFADSAAGVAASTCKALGGTYDSTTEKCDLSSLTAKICTDLGGTYTSGKCNIPAAPVSFASAGTCPSGQYSNGFNQSGGLSCLPLPVVTSSTPVVVVPTPTPPVKLPTMCYASGGGCSISSQQNPPSTCCSAGYTTTGCSPQSSSIQCSQGRTQKTWTTSCYCVPK